MRELLVTGHERKSDLCLHFRRGLLNTRFYAFAVLLSGTKLGIYSDHGI